MGDEEAAGGRSAPGTDARGSFDAVEAVFKAGYFDGMYRRLQAKFDGLPAQAIEDALHHAAEKCALEPTPPDNVRGWLFAVAQNRLRDEVRRKATEAFDPDNPAHNRDYAPSAEDEVLTAEEAARAETSYRTVVEHVKTWQVAKMRTVMLLVLEAAKEGVPLSNERLADLASGLLAQSSTVRLCQAHPQGRKHTD